MILKLAHLYPKYLNLYGDEGNIISLDQRCRWRNISFEITEIDIGSKQNLADFDLIFIGGGQDSGQVKVAKDLLAYKSELQDLAAAGMPMLAVCGGYQLFGKSYQCVSGEALPGIEILDIETKASEQRLIGNVSAELLLPLSIESDLKTLVGFENHAGRTFITSEQTKALAKINNGFGNDGSGQFEGAYKNNVIGTYLHGSLLPKNPHLADEIILAALKYSGQDLKELKTLDDGLEFAAHQKALMLN